MPSGAAPPQRIRIHSDLVARFWSGCLNLPAHKDRSCLREPTSPRVDAYRHVAPRTRRLNRWVATPTTIFRGAVDGVDGKNQGAGRGVDERGLVTSRHSSADR